MKKWFCSGAILLGIASMSIGCGGGGGGSSPAPAVTKATLTNEAVGAAKSNLQSGGISSVFGGVTGKAVVGKTQGELMRLLMHNSTAISRSGGTGYLSTVNLYYSYNVNSSNSVTLSLYTDSGLTQPAGTITATTSNTTASYPISVRMTMNFTAGAYIFSGTADANFSSATAGTITGTFNSGGQSYSINLSIGSNGTTTQVTVSAGSGVKVTTSAVAATDGSGDIDITISSNMGIGGTGVINTDSSGSLTLTNSVGVTQATMMWDASGNATITFADGTTATATV